MTLFIHPMDPSEFAPKRPKAQSLGWKTVWHSTKFDDMDRYVKDYMHELTVDKFIERLDNQTECNLIILE